MRHRGNMTVAASVVAMVASLTMTTNGLAEEASSANFSMESSSFSGGGGNVSSSPSFSLTETLGEVVETGDSASANFSINGGFLNDIDLDNDGVLGEDDGCPAEFSGCADVDMDGCIDPPDTDADSDGVTPGMCDCDDTNLAVWSVPTAATGLEVVHPGAAGLTTVSWIASVDPGGTVSAYDLLRATAADGFLVAQCLASEIPDTMADDDGAPLAQGSAYFYLARAVNDCPSGDGPVHNGSRGPRSLKSCP